MRDLELKRFNFNAAVRLEHSNQIRKWGIQDHTPAEWLMFATEEVGEVAEAIAEWQYGGADPSNVVKEAIQAATLLIKIAEMFNAVTPPAEEDSCPICKGIGFVAYNPNLNPNENPAIASAPCSCVTPPAGEEQHHG